LRPLKAQAGGSFEPLERDLYKVSVFDLPHVRRLAFGVVLGQAAVTAIAALCAWLLGGQVAGLSALLGGGIATMGSLAMAAVMFSGAAQGSARRALSAFYVGEAAKLAVVVVLFVVVLKVVRVAPLAMFAAFAVAFLVYWIALLGALPTRGGGARGGA
jgi:ATP synthase protein I